MGASGIHDRLTRMYLSDQPIVPGSSAGGYRLGELLSHPGVDFVDDEASSLANPIVRHRSAPIRLWLNNGRIAQIAVGKGYAGKLDGVIGPGSTLADVEAAIGPRGRR